MTGETITHAGVFRDSSTNEDVGIAVEQDEAVLGESGLASPVFDSWGGVVGAIGIVVPSASWPIPCLRSRCRARRCAGNLARTRLTNMARAAAEHRQR